jgi:hypothetical protein
VTENGSASLALILDARSLMICMCLPLLTTYQTGKQYCSSSQDETSKYMFRGKTFYVISLIFFEFRMGNVWCCTGEKEQEPPQVSSKVNETKDFQALNEQNTQRVPITHLE